MSDFDRFRGKPNFFGVRQRLSENLKYPYTFLKNKVFVLGKEWKNRAFKIEGYIAIYVQKQRLLGDLYMYGFNREQKLFFTTVERLYLGKTVIDLAHKAQDLIFQFVLKESHGESGLGI